LSAGDYVHCALAQSDCVVVVGHDITEKPPVVLISQERSVIHINFNEAEVDDVYIPTLEIVGDVSHSLWAISENISAQAHWDFTNFNKFKNKLLTHLSEKTDSDSFPVKPQRLIKDLRDVLPADGILALDNGMYKIWIARNYFAREQNTVLLDNALATMGAGLPAAMAAKLVDPSKPVIAVVGDGGFMISAQELETAQRLGLNLVVLIINDNGFGMIKWKQAGNKMEDFALSFSNPDFVKFAESFGIQGVRINNTAELAPALKRGLSHPGIFLIDCPIDYSENNIVFNQELKNDLCKI
ncbi:MAG: hypothetical protein ACD_72C00068G0006, partial [uncultured bacterium]